MGRRKILVWLQGLVMAFGGGGLFVVTFFDSSVLSFPFFPDAVLIELCIANRGGGLFDELHVCEDAIAPVSEEHRRNLPAFAPLGGAEPEIS